MNGEVQLIVNVGATEYVPSGPYTIFTPAGGTTSYLSDYAGVTAAQMTIGTIITGPVGGLVTTATVTAFDSITGEITFAAGYLDYSNVVPQPLQINVQITFLVDTTNSYFLDLFENESISQNWKFQDLNSFTAQGSFTREFRVPYSATNQLALGALFDVNVDAGASNFFHYKLPAEIRVDTLPIATGYVRVRKIYKQQNRINEVELAFYDETPDLARNIG